MRYHIILPAFLLLLSGCRDDTAAARAAKAAEEARIDREVAKRVSGKRQASAERKDMLHTIRLTGFIVLTGGAVTGLVWLRRPQGAGSVGQSVSHQQTPPRQTYDHHPVLPRRILDVQQPSPPSRHRRGNRGKGSNHETASRP
jgi:hypothetical protein